MTTPKAGTRLHTFTIDWKSDIDQKQYNGVFTCRKQSMSDKSKISVRRSQLCGGMYCVRDENGVPTGQGIDEETEYLNFMIAVLDTVIVQKPDWFKMDEVGDEMLVQHVFGEVMKFENSFRPSRRGEDPSVSNNVPGSESSGAAKSAQANSGSGPAPVVGAQILATLDA